MLVLSRKPGEEIIIGDNVRLRVLAVRGNQVRLGLIAPIEVHIRREELNADSEGFAASATHSTCREAKP